MHFALSSTGTGSLVALAPGTVVVGRDDECEVTIKDATISRRHAAVTADASAVEVSDLGSSNGTFVNGARVTRARLAEGDELTFGSVQFRVVRLPEAGPEIVRVRPVAPAAAHPDGGVTSVLQAVTPGTEELTQRKLSLLLRVSTALSRTPGTDALLKQVAEHLFDVMDVDRAAILLINGDGEIETRLARDRRGNAMDQPVPRSIARRVVADRAAVITHDAGGDMRFTGESIVVQSVQSAMCAPMIGLDGSVQGALYVDNLGGYGRFDAADLEFLVAFSGIAGVAMENDRYAERSRREAVARGNFERFFTPALAARIAGSGAELRLGGENRPVTVLFSDIRGFTTLSENMQPESLARLMSEYFTAMVECIFRYGGTLDKFIGDAIMAQWGAPVSHNDDADRALAAAFDMLKALDELNANWHTQGRPPLAVGIGIAHGNAFAGYIGSERRLEYTVLGDTVNTASRLCSAAGAGEVLVTASTIEMLRRPVTSEARTAMHLKGKTNPVAVRSVSPLI